MTAAATVARWEARPLPLATADLVSLCREPEAVGRVARALREDGYTMAPFAALVDATPRDLLSRSHLFSLFLYERLSRSEAPRDLLATLFVLGAELDRDRYARLPRDLRATLEKLGLVVVDGQKVSGTITITEFGGRLFFADKLFEYREGDLHFYPNDDIAMPPHYSSMALLHHPRPSGGSLLDLGCGSGCLSVLFADRFQEIEAVDLAERSVWFTRLNAHVNAIPLRCYQQDCFELPRDPRWDCVLFNAPSEVRYESASSFRYQGDSVIRRFLGTKLPELLAPNGTCLMWGILSLRAQDASAQDLVASWLPRDGGYSVSVSVDARSPFSLREAHVRQRRVPFGSWALRDRTDEPLFWAHLARHDIREIATVIIEVKRSSRGAASP